MEMRMKKGRRERRSRIGSLWMSVVTQRERQRAVTKSRRASAVGKVVPGGRAGASGPGEGVGLAESASVWGEDGCSR